MDTTTYSIEKFKPGLCFHMGKDGTWWRVLEVNAEKKTAIVIADKEVCEEAYNKKYKDITWEQCTLRKWLNGEYFEKTFSEQEREAIMECEIKTPDNAKYGTKGGADTKDRIWLLSIDEANQYFADDEDRATGFWWWLRSPGYYQDCAASVSGGGSVYDSGLSVSSGSGIRPAFLLNLNSSFFKQMFEDEDNLTVKVPELFIQDDTVKRVRPGIKNVQIPEGVTEIPESCFAGMEKLKEVSLPSTLKKIGKEAFRGCVSLKAVTGTNGTITYGKYVFSGCKKLNYTAEMFRNTGKLCDSFAEHMENCGLEELAWVLMYQKGAVWENALSKKITKDNADKILDVMTEYIAEAKKSPKKQAAAAAAFVTANVMLLSADKIKEFCEALTGKKLADLAEGVTSDPTVAHVLGTANSGVEGNGSLEEQSGQVPQKVMPDGSIWYGKIESLIKTGCRFIIGNTGTKWRILSVDQEKQTALVIADKEVCEEAYNKKYKDITWEQCTLRQWLNGEYFEKTFSKQEREAIMECEIKTHDNAKYGTKGGADTKDRIWLLSIDEANQYFADDEDRATGSWWWLRSPGYNQRHAAGVKDGGSVRDFGDVVHYDYGIRPAFLLNLKSSFLKSIISTNQNGEAVIFNPELVIKNGVLLTADPTITDVNLPFFVKEIQAKAFEDCKKLKNLSWEAPAMKIDPAAFRSDAEVKLPAAFYLGSKLPHENFVEFAPAEPAVIANLLILAGKKSAYRRQAIGTLTIENVQSIAEEILRISGSMKKIKSTENIMRFLLSSYQGISDEMIGKLCDLLKADATNAAGIKLVQDAMKQKSKGTTVIAKEIFDLPEEILKTTEEDLQGLPGLLAVLAGNSDYAAMYQSGWVNTSEFKKEALDSYQKLDSVENQARELDHTALMRLLKVWQQTASDAWYGPYAAYANESELADLLKEMKTWMKDKTMRERIIRVRGAILLNDTNDAMRYADSMGLLGRYAQLRGMDEDTVRDSMMSDMGLDEAGHKTWTLAGKEYLMALNKDLTVTLTDETGKVLKSIPKKGAEPEEYAAVNKEYTSIKKDIKPTAKLRNDKIFADFLSGASHNGNAWKKAYLKNPLLRLLAQLIVWEQDGNTFVLKDDGRAYDVEGSLYEITDQPVIVAHPMVMGQKLTAKWQDYFVSNSLKQPFEQVWEPVADADSVKPGRYDGCTVPLYTLMNKEKHGIIMEGQSRITLKDCSAGLKLIEGHHDWVNNEFEITDFKYEKFTRQVNHIVVHLDKATVAGRIKKDDVSVAQWLKLFTAAQINEFIDIATRSEATNCTALLLEYKSKTYPDIDPFAEFTLDLL